MIEIFCVIAVVYVVGVILGSDGVPRRHDKYDN
jgi:hypothetical protein